MAAFARLLECLLKTCGDAPMIALVVVNIFSNRMEHAWLQGYPPMHLL